MIFGCLKDFAIVLMYGVLLISATPYLIIIWMLVWKDVALERAVSITAETPPANRWQFWWSSWCSETFQTELKEKAVWAILVKTERRESQSRTTRKAAFWMSLVIFVQSRFDQLENGLKATTKASWYLGKEVKLHLTWFNHRRCFCKFFESTRECEIFWTSITQQVQTENK